jgi:hypothetical protein
LFAGERTMAKNCDHAHPEVYFTGNFLKNHVCIGDAAAKKRAEVVFQRRDARVSTVLCLTRAELVQLAGEIHRRQIEFSTMPEGVFTTLTAYDLWSRGGPQAKDKQRATMRTDRFRFAVRCTADGIFAVCHFDGVPQIP